MPRARTTPAAGRSPASLLLLLGVAVFAALAIFTAREILRAFDERAGQARAAAVFDLVATRTAVRPTDAPGAIAWLRRAIERAGFFDRALIEPGDAAPESLGRLAALLREPPHTNGGIEPVLQPPTTASVPGPLRSQYLLRVGQRTLVVTRRQSLEADAASRQFLHEAGAVIAVKDELFRLERGNDGASRPGAEPHVVRFYAIHEDGSLVSLPWVDHPGDAAESNLLNVELATLSTRSTLPAFAPEDFFFRSTRESYSGFYLDLGGKGLVSTLIAPLPLSDKRMHAMLAIDLGFDVDWTRLAASLEPPIQGAAAYIVPGSSASWSALGQALADSAPSDLRRAVADAAVRIDPAVDNDAPMRHAVVANGAVAAFRVSDRQWLLAWFPQAAPAFPFAAIALLSTLLILLLGGFEVNRRRAHREQRAAEREFQEKQNLLNTMQVPLVVVDPNTDAIVSANQAADVMGFAAGRRFADLVWPDARAREHYQRMQIASPEPRRAYGVPVAVPGSDGQPERRYAVVRSVAVTAPIDALQADERHRLGVLVVLDESSDLQLLLEDTDAAAHRDERRRLAGLLSHGVDTLARVLEYSLTRGHDTAFSTWLATYLERRVSVTAWLLDHWDAHEPLPRESVIDATQARATVDRFSSVLALAASDRELRQRLHWDNGTLSKPAVRVLDVSLDWPADVVVTCPVHGGFGLFLNELIVNAVRHGVPGSVPAIAIGADRVRGEVTCEVRNATAGSAPDLDHVDPYGGVSIVRAMARLFEWRDFEIQISPEGEFVVKWSMPSGTQSRLAD